MSYLLSVTVTGVPAAEPQQQLPEGEMGTQWRTQRTDSSTDRYSSSWGGGRGGQRSKILPLKGLTDGVASVCGPHMPRSCLTDRRFIYETRDQKNR